ncbi:MAG: alanine--tRNA ligase [Dehalococcoidia bacterium]|nr:alanine--tRNA ligase [Dehalococcoidia bacterium]
MPSPSTTSDIRQAYFDFFAARHHRVEPSASLIPAGDPTLLLTSAGMVPFKPYFTGEQAPPNPRLASSQKCFRTSDIDSVGDTKHLTFFEMLGNFSIGDYFKREAIAWAWEFVTDVLKLPPERLWVTYYKEGDVEDLEARDFWLQAAKGKLSSERIVPLGKKYNWWGPAGEEGPCGPCSEIHFAFDPARVTVADLTGDSPHAIEIWNLVFTQFYHHRDGRRTSLPKPNIDTGMGLERATAVARYMQDPRIVSVYQTDAFDYLVQQAAALAGASAGRDPDADYALRVLAEHARGVTFLIADGVVPSNEGRGYVLRRILRRAVRYARKAGIQGMFLTVLAESVVDRMAHVYPELARERAFILSVIRGEEERFSQTLDAGVEILEEMLRSQAKGTSLSGTSAFKLHDTYGFPVDITQDIAREHGMTVDIPGFDREMARQREQSRAKAKFGLGDKTSPETYRALALGEVRFTGYERLREQTVVIGLLAGGQPAERAAKGAPVEVVLRQTPFYAEGGGQVGDTGELRGPHGTVRVTDTIAPIHGLIVHRGEVAEGEIAVGEPLDAVVDAARRADVVRNHTGTHLLHAALRKVLGAHVRQAGSHVGPDRLRFDFAQPTAIDAAGLRQIQTLVNDAILENLTVAHKVMSYKDAIAQGALAFFGDKYGDVVRTCGIGDGDGQAFSFELCGGTHARATGEIGLLHVESEGSIAAGTRRIEAVTGHGAGGALAQRHALLIALANKLQSSPADLSARLASLLEDLDRERKRASSLERELALRQADSIAAQAQVIDGVTVLTATVAAGSADALRAVAESLRDKLGSAVIVLAAVIGDRPAFAAVVTKDLVARGYNAGAILREVAKIAGGGGGGRPDLAQAGGKDPSKIAEALALVPTLLKKS